MRTLVVAILSSALVFAYNPPVDSAGPVTVRIMEPSLGAYGSGGVVELSRAGMPFTIPVTVENSGAETVSGTVRLQVIDRWTAEPASAPFSVSAHGRTMVEFKATFGEGTYNAGYPVRAVAEFEYGGKRMAARPVLILNVRQPNPPRSRWQLPWAPLKAPAKGVMGLWRVPLHRESVKTEPVLQPGASGRDVYDMGPVVQFGVRNAAREAIAVKLGSRPPSMREATRAATVEYPVALPSTTPLRLVFATAVSGAEGALFRVRAVPFDAPAGAEGTVLFERRAQNAAWQEAEADLGRLAGAAVRLQLETVAAEGMNGYGYWAEPAILAGELPHKTAFPPASNAHSRVLGQVAGHEVRVWAGARGVLDGAVGFTQNGKSLMFHGFHARVAGDELEDVRSASELMSALEEPAGSHYRVRHHFGSWAGEFDLVSDMWVEAGALRTRFAIEHAPAPRPWLNVYLEELTAGPWNRRAERIYAGPGNVIRNPRAFHMGFDGHNEATSFVGFDFEGGPSMVEALDVPPTRLDVDPETRTYSLNTPHAQTRSFIPAANVWSAAKTWRSLNGLHASGGVNKLAGRFVFDLWSGHYAGSADALERAFHYGLTNSAVVWHNWQRWGYDYRLPDIYPPNPEYGTEADFKRLAAVCRKAGVLFAPHDNYIDYYPDSEDFSYRNIVFHPDGQPYKAWFHYGPMAQSYRARADRVRPFLERNLKLIRDGFAPDAYFIDVWSSIGPYDYWTEDGEFRDRVSTRKEWGEAFAWIRDFLGNNAPQISEAGHDQLIGWLDGAQAQHLRVENKSGESFVWNIACEDAERIPWFDAAHHDRFVLHGAGYPGRYDSGLKGHGIYSDDYIATEVLTAHPAMVSEPFSRDVVRKYWLLDGLMRGLALRTMEDFTFVDGNLHRQAVKWSGGAEVFVNRGSEDWSAGGHALSQYAFYARVPMKEGIVEAAVERLGGATVEWSRSPESLYFNARQAKLVQFGDIATDGGFRLTRDAGGLRVTPLPSSERFTIRMRALPWKLAPPSEAEALDEGGRVLSRLPLKKQGDEFELKCEPGVFAYRLR